MEPKEKTAEVILDETFEPQPLELLSLYSKKHVIKAMQQYAAQETAQLREALKELIPIAEFTLNYYRIYKSHDKAEAAQEAIENARRLTNQP